MIRLFKHYIHRAQIILASVETAIFFVAIYVGMQVRFPSSTPNLELLLPKAVLFTLVMMVSLVSVGLYQRHLRDEALGVLLRIGVAFVGGTAFMSLSFYLLPEFFVGRGVFLIALVFSLVLVLVNRAFFGRIADHHALQRRVLVIGAGEMALTIDRHLKRKTDRRGFVIVGYVPFGQEEVKVDKTQCLRKEESLINLALQLGVSEVVLALTERRGGALPVEEMLDCKLSGIEIIDLQTFMERQTGKVLLEILKPSWLIFSDGFAQGAGRAFGKRVFDILASLILLSFALPIMVIAAVLIYLDDRGPVFYSQVRVGQNWKLVRILKFRSMRVDAEKNGAQFAQKNDSRVTRVGSFIRKTRIDELPQLINVLKGDMSFVGPRPERPEFVEEFSKTIPYYAERHRVKPGVTGWAQISYPYGASHKDTIEKFQYDLYYVKNYSMFLDFSILLQTAEVVLWGKGAR
ncbi:MAG: TIGR03013 family PEP-CTERM/XrtA system glycosyltransferase [Gammaproteobacteria bacterium]|nr:TIGR03013 family PEP-CTERM/XrtA system glycosyltransferase [Gammaproteobacteria bacterium]